MSIPIYVVVWRADSCRPSIVGAALSSDEAERIVIQHCTCSAERLKELGIEPSKKTYPSLLPLDTKPYLRFMHDYSIKVVYYGEKEPDELRAYKVSVESGKVICKELDDMKDILLAEKEYIDTLVEYPMSYSERRFRAAYVQACNEEEAAAKTNTLLRETGLSEIKP